MVHVDLPDGHKQVPAKVVRVPRPGALTYDVQLCDGSVHVTGLSVEAVHAPTVSQILRCCSCRHKEAAGLPSCYTTADLELRVDGKLLKDLDPQLEEEEKELLVRAFTLQIQRADFSVARPAKTSPKAGGGKAGGGKVGGSKAGGSKAKMAAEAGAGRIDTLVYHHDASGRKDLRYSAGGSIIKWAQVSDSR